MKCKATVLLLRSLMLSVTFFCSYHLFSAVQAEKPSGAKSTTTKLDKPKVDPKDMKAQMPPGMSEDEMKMFSEFIDSLDQETIDALTAIGEEIIKEADELGIDPFEYIELQAQIQKEFEDEDKDVKKAPKNKGNVQMPFAPPVNPTADAQTAQDIFNGIVKVIPEIIQKTASDISLANDILPFKYRLDDLVFYFTKLGGDALLKYIGDPAFAPLIANAKKLYQELVTLNDQFYVAEFSLEGENPYEILGVSQGASQKDIVTAYDKISQITDPDMLELQLIREGKNDQQIKSEVEKARKRFEIINDSYYNLRSKEEALYILESILDAVALAVDQHKVLDEAKNVLQKYEPDAIKLKQDQEKIEKDARKKQDDFLKKRPIVSRSFNMPPPSGKYKRSSAGGSGRYGKGGGGGYTPSRKRKETKTGSKLAKIPSAGKKSGGGGGDKGKKKDGDDKDKKKKKKDGTPKRIEGKEGSAGGGKGKPQPSSNKDVIGAITVLEKSFKAIKDFIKDSPLIKGTTPGAVEGEGLYEFLTTHFVGADDVTRKAEKDPYVAFMVELTKKFSDIAKDINKTIKKLKDKKEDQKQFKDDVVKLFKKFEETDAYQHISIILKTLKDDTPSLFKGQPPVNANIVNEKKEFILKAKAPVVPGEPEEEPYIKLLRDAYKKGFDAVKPKLPEGPKPPAGP